ncbi:MAG: hypothetical protein ABSE91_00145 [Patescibacteria group bacterium]|jgi:hypothetical protein
MTLEIIKVIPEYLKAVLSWPVAIFVLGLIFILKFSDSIREFLKNIYSLRVGPVEATQRPPENIDRKIENSLEQKGITLTEEQINLLDQEFLKISGESEEKEKKIQEKENFINYLVQRSELYEFLYLNLFFVPNTKIVLKWAHDLGSFTKDLFNIIYEPRIPDKLERESIFNVLLQNIMIQKIDDSYIVTEKGIRFLKFIGLVK